jgi:ATP-dependent RNA helicase DDX27
VINYEAPQSHEIYLHRVGRTARAGRTGRACTIAAEPDRKIVKAAVKTARAQGAKIASRSVLPAAVDAWHQRLLDLEDEVEAVLADEKEEKALTVAEREVRKGENLVLHEAEIMSRPRRTWFETEKDKGRVELNGDAVLVKKKGKLSNKQKKKLDDRDERREGSSYRKTKADKIRTAPGKGKPSPGKGKPSLDRGQSSSAGGKPGVKRANVKGKRPRK